MMVEEAEINRLFKMLLKTRRESFPLLQDRIKAPSKRGVYISYSPHHRVHGGEIVLYPYLSGKASA